VFLGRINILSTEISWFNSWSISGHQKSRNNFLLW